MGYLVSEWENEMHEKCKEAEKDEEDEDKETLTICIVFLDFRFGCWGGHRIAKGEKGGLGVGGGGGGFSLFFF